MLPDYLLALNIVIACMQRINRSIVLRGFLHNENCISYWECDRMVDKGTPDFFSKHRDLNLITAPSSRPTVHIVDETPDDAQLREFNLEIRRNPYGRLEDPKYRWAKKVEDIEEFTVEFDGYPKKKAEISVGAPGALAMLQSLAVAMDAQGQPKTALTENLAQLASLHS